MQRIVLAAITLMILTNLAAAAPDTRPSTQPGTQPSQSSPQLGEPQAAAAENPALAIWRKGVPSLVVVKYTWQREFGSEDFSAAGIVVGEDGLVMFPIDVVSPNYIPDDQMKDFKIIVPSATGEPTELEAALEGRDPRCGTAFARTKDAQKWHAVKFQEFPIGIGDGIYSVGLLPKGSGYKAYVTNGFVSALLRGPVTQVLVSGSLASVGGVVFAPGGQAIGFVHPQLHQDVLLDDPNNPENLNMVYLPPRLYIPAGEFLLSLQDRPTGGGKSPVSWLGCVMTGKTNEEAEYFKLKDHPVIQVGDVVPGSPADKAGLKSLDLIVKMNGADLERGDLPPELPMILNHNVERMKPGTTVTFTVLRKVGEPTQEIAVKLEAQPRMPTSTHRFYARDLGFVVREAVFADAYPRKLPKALEPAGVVVATVKPQSPAQVAHLSARDGEDWIKSLNGKPVTDLDQFKKDYQQIRKDHPKDPVVLVVSRLGGHEETINIQPPQSETGGGGDGGLPGPMEP